jgi:hypothetical protein
MAGLSIFRIGLLVMPFRNRASIIRTNDPLLLPIVISEYSIQYPSTEPLRDGKIRWGKLKCLFKGSFPLNFKLRSFKHHTPRSASHNVLSRYGKRSPPPFPIFSVYTSRFSSISPSHHINSNGANFEQPTLLKAFTVPSLHFVLYTLNL